MELMLRMLGIEVRLGASGNARDAVVRMLGGERS
jgi:hypothetical protein